MMQLGGWPITTTGIYAQYTPLYKSYRHRAEAVHGRFWENARRPLSIVRGRSSVGRARRSQCT